MTTSGFMTGGPRRQRETSAQREARLAREHEMLEAAREDIRAGRCISGLELEAWLKAWAADSPEHAFKPMK
ncbi:hypothetical protein [Phenylobacterium sp.]|uniref:hypothetical protein n=1 Tax=Phenylobacterium sp. TaxID=1871053 RepID=UPI0025E96A95|nr:hypothetical protein [Phenylobacterium sp.]MBX3483522.1 hypothetical protein [Phenylobacterium sp.]MCW5760706.1 hypothetical protein [Phenylobacterium sp.]